MEVLLTEIFYDDKYNDNNDNNERGRGAPHSSYVIYTPNKTRSGTKKEIFKLSTITIQFSGRHENKCSHREYN